MFLPTIIIIVIKYLSHLDNKFEFFLFSEPTQTVGLG